MSFKKILLGSVIGATISAPVMAKSYIELGASTGIADYGDHATLDFDDSEQFGQLNLNIGLFKGVSIGANFLESSTSDQLGNDYDVESHAFYLAFHTPKNRNSWSFETHVGVGEKSIDSSTSQFKEDILTYGIGVNKYFDNVGLGVFYRGDEGDTSEATDHHIGFKLSFNLFSNDKPMEMTPEPVVETIVEKEVIQVVETVQPEIQEPLEYFEYNDSVYFNSYAFEPTEKGLETINSVIEIVEQNPEFLINITGHSDSTGDKTKNLKLSQDRADKVRDIILSQSSLIEKENVVSKGLGDTSPIATNKTKEGRAQNRRVEIKISGYK